MRFVARLPRAFAVTALLAPAAGLSGCSSSSSGGGPVIDNLQVPSTFTVAGLVYTSQGTISYHDNSAAVTTLHTKIPLYTLDAKSNVMSGTQTATNSPIVLGFQSPNMVASGTKVEIDVSVIDANGAESNVVVEHIAVP
jgi:hypothetical protein